MPKKKYDIGYTVDSTLTIHVVAESDEEAIRIANQIYEEEVMYEEPQPDNDSEDWEIYLNYESFPEGFVMTSEPLDNGDELIEDEDEEFEDDEDEPMNESLLPRFYKGSKRV